MTNAEAESGKLSQSSSAFEDVARFVATQGAVAKPYLTALGLLADGGVSVDQLVRETTLPRRSIERLLDLLGDDLEAVGDVFRLRTAVSDLYRSHFPVPADSSIFCLEPGDSRLPSKILEIMEDVVSRAPSSKAELDHVVATPETVVRRALFLNSLFTLSGRRVLFVGDHDMTSIALAMVNPAVQIGVADIDDDVLGFISQTASEARARIRCMFADFRLGLPPSARQWADIAFTDPPYTPDGVQLFTARSLEGLSNLDTGRVLVAYGFGNQPALGLKVQETLRELRVVYEAIFPSFNRYDLAHAIGSTSNLYVLRASSKTKDVLSSERFSRRLNIYSHGTQSLEGGIGVVPPSVVAALVRVAEGPNRTPVSVAVGSAWPPDTPGAPTSLGSCLAPTHSGTSPCSTNNALIADLRHDSGSLLLRFLIASRASRLAVLIRNEHPATTTGHEQERLQTTMNAKFAIRFHRSSPTPGLAIIEAELVRSDQRSQAEHAQGFLLERPYAKVINAWREALISTAGIYFNRALTKKAARALIESYLAMFDPDAYVIELPRATLDDVLRTVSMTVADLEKSLDGLPLIDAALRRSSP